MDTDRERFGRIEEIFHRVRTLPPDEHQSALDEACGGDADLRREVEALLAHVGSTSPDIKPPDIINVRGEGAPAIPGLPPDTFAGYTIVREIHRGGQGIVFQAIQNSTKRMVALKVLRAGPLASEKATKRFTREIKLLVQLRHPNIIAMFDTGTALDGQQYYVMDYVRGQPLHEHVHNSKPTLEDVLKLFCIVCDTVQFAHQKGVIHRDLKPTNILVDTHGVPKVLDFGLAKPLVNLDDSVLSTSQDVVGTLAYMSPEQVGDNPQEIDQRSDVYALGVILYELLTGTYPYSIEGGLSSVSRRIAETPPRSPRQAWSKETGIRFRSSDGSRSGGCPIGPQLEVVLFKALAKERGQRYQSATAIADDIRRFLADEPVKARAASGVPSRTWSGWEIIASQGKAFWQRIASHARNNWKRALLLSTIGFLVAYGITRTYSFVKTRNERSSSQSVASMAVKMINGVLLAEIVNPPERSMLNAARNVEYRLDALAARASVTVDPRLWDLAKLRRQELLAWSEYGQTPEEAYDNPEAPVELIELSLQFYVMARDLAVEFECLWVLDADIIIAQLTDDIRTRKENREPNGVMRSKSPTSASSNPP